MDPDQVAVPAVRVRCRLPGALRPRRVQHDERDGDPGHREERGRQPDRGRDPEPVGHHRDADRGDPDAHRLRHLTNAHGEAAPVRREPAHHHPAARGVRARRGGAREPERHRQQRDAVRQRTRRAGQRGDGQPGQQGEAFASTVDDEPPQHEREHHADGRCGGDQPCLGERVAEVAVQGRDQERRPVHHDRGGGLRPGADGKHRPAPCVTDLGRATSSSACSPDHETPARIHAPSRSRRVACEKSDVAASTVRTFAVRTSARVSAVARRGPRASWAGPPPRARRRRRGTGRAGGRCS